METSNIVHIEVCQNVNSTLSDKELKNLILNEIVTYRGSHILNDRTLAEQPNLKEHIMSIISCDNLKGQLNYKHLGERVLKFHIYRLSQEDAADDVFEFNEEQISAMTQWTLPSKQFYKLWENLHFEHKIKDELLSFVETAILFSTHNINPNIISFNRIVLLHGPPGTGKTSLCQALAQKISIRLRETFQYTELVEINSHSLFSKWFSESGKLVMHLFNDIKERLRQENSLICILIDEVESLAHVRKACQNGIEPTDSIRAVNALLTQLDQIKRYPNVLILTTSNLNEAVDLAFLDRADIKQYIGHLKRRSIYSIYMSCLEELMRTKLIQQQEMFPFELPNDFQEKSTIELSESEVQRMKDHGHLISLSIKSEGLTGRTLRKIPFLTYAALARTQPSLTDFLTAMEAVIMTQQLETEKNI